MNVIKHIFTSPIIEPAIGRNAAPHCEAHDKVEEVGWEAEGLGDRNEISFAKKEISINCDLV